MNFEYYLHDINGNANGRYAHHDIDIEFKVLRVDAIDGNNNEHRCQQPNAQNGGQGAQDLCECENNRDIVK